GAARGGELVNKDFLKQSPHSIAVEPQLLLRHINRHPPVGPNRSVLMRAGSWPRFTSDSAADSTSGVGPQTKTKGRSSGGHATVLSIAASMRRCNPCHPSGTLRVSVWITPTPEPLATSLSSSSR